MSIMDMIPVAWIASTQELADGHLNSDARNTFAGGNPSHPDVNVDVTPTGWPRPGDPTSPAARTGATPNSAPPRGVPTTGSGAAGPELPDGQECRDSQSCAAVGDHSSDAARRPTRAQDRDAASDSTTAGDHGPRDTHSPTVPGGWLRDPVIGVLADVLNDFEQVRIANANRVRILTRDEADSDGETRGFGLTEDHPEVAKLILTVKAMEQAEHEAILNLQRALRKHPLAPFQKRHKGLGEKQFARLLATIGDPYWHDLHQRSRTASELWAYCGFHVIRTSVSGQGRHDAHGLTAAAGSNPTPGAALDANPQRTSAPGVAPKRTRGQQSNWSEDARKRVWVIASAMPKFPGGHYESVYRAAREKYADATHSVECVRCGPSGKPALVGSDLSDGHKHARAIRIVAKELLKDLWRESRDLYEAQENDQ